MSVYVETYQNDVVRIRVLDLLLPEVVDGELGHPGEVHKPAELLGYRVYHSILT